MRERERGWELLAPLKLLENFIQKDNTEKLRQIVINSGPPRVRTLNGLWSHSLLFSQKLLSDFRLLIHQLVYYYHYCYYNYWCSNLCGDLVLFSRLAPLESL